MGSRRLKKGFRGSLLGTFVGDALGAPVEGLSHARLVREHGRIREMGAGRGGRGRGRYTDDTQMMIAVAEWLLESDDHDPGGLAARIVESYDPARGYGQGTTNVLRRLRAGVPWQAASEAVFPRGSFGNGAAIRITPCALLEHRDPEALFGLVEASALATHSHPLGIAGALLQSRQIVMAFLSREESFDPIAFVVSLRSVTESSEFRHKLATVEWLLDREAVPDLARTRLGANATALGSVPTALYCFLSNPASFEEAVACAVNLGGDTDSIGAMTGAIAGAYHGEAAIPSRWRTALEEGDKGASYVVGLADRLLEVSLRPRLHWGAHLH